MNCFRKTVALMVKRRAVTAAKPIVRSAISAMKRSHVKGSDLMNNVIS